MMQYDLDELKKLIQEFQKDASITQTMDTNSLSDFMGWLLSQLKIN